MSATGFALKFAVTVALFLSVTVVEELLGSLKIAFSAGIAVQDKKP
jgi:hypothetical protein